jgi:hypothetical protein
LAPALFCFAALQSLTDNAFVTLHTRCIHGLHVEVLSWDWKVRLGLPQPDRSVAGMNYQQIAASIELAVNLVLANLARGCDRYVQINVAVAGAQIHIGSKGFRYL